MSKSPKETKSTRKPKADEVRDRAKLVRLLRLARWWVARLGDDLPFPLWNDWQISEAGNELAAAVGVRSLLTMRLSDHYSEQKDDIEWRFRIAIWESLVGAPLVMDFHVKDWVDPLLFADDSAQVEFRHLVVERDQWRAFRASAANALRIFAISEIKERLADTSGSTGSRGDSEPQPPNGKQEAILWILYEVREQGHGLSGKEIVKKLETTSQAIDDPKNLPRYTTPLQDLGLIFAKPFRLTKKGIDWVEQNSKRRRRGSSRRS